MELQKAPNIDRDYCRIGSLEIYDFTFVCEVTDYCRIGSLEMERSAGVSFQEDYCRIGSLEKDQEVLFPRGQ